MKELDDLDRVVNKVAVPLSYADELTPCATTSKRCAAVLKECLHEFRHRVDAG